MAVEREVYFANDQSQSQYDVILAVLYHGNVVILISHVLYVELRARW